MTKEEIIKALECCSKNMFECEICPCNCKDGKDCMTEMCLNAINLINQQSDEIKLLKQEMVKAGMIMQSESEKKIKAEIEIVKFNKDDLITEPDESHCQCCGDKRCEDGESIYDL